MDLCFYKGFQVGQKYTYIGFGDQFSTFLTVKQYLLIQIISKQTKF